MSTLVAPLEEVSSGRTLLVRRWQVCVALSLAALFIHGYHPYAEDAGIYLPAIKKQLDPALYPQGSQFFMLQAHWSVFTRAVALSTRIAHIPLPYMLLLWYVAGLFFTIMACWRIAELCLRSESAGGWGASLVAAAISMPAAGCALLLYDPYLTSRSVSTPLILFSTSYLLRRRPGYALAFWLGAFVFHPLMAAIAAAFLLLLLLVRSERWPVYFAGLAGSAFLAAFGMGRIAPFAITQDYRAAALTRRFFFLNRWHWYELFGAMAPVAIFAAVAWTRRKNRNDSLFQLSLATALFGVSAIIGGAAVTWIPSLFTFARFQPMRAYQLIYLLFLLLPVNLAISSLFRSPFSRKVGFAITLLLIGGGMYLVQHETFPSSAHIEWPWSEKKNSWQQAFDWVRANTPTDAVFALDPDYSDLPGDDDQLFRAEAERSALPDRAKDGGVAALFPELASEWESEVSVSGSLRDLQGDDSETKLLHAGATWMVVPAPPNPRFDCPYWNKTVSVCRLSGSASRRMSASIRKP